MTAPAVEAANKAKVGNIARNTTKILFKKGERFIFCFEDSENRGRKYRRYTRWLGGPEQIARQVKKWRNEVAPPLPETPYQVYDIVLRGRVA